MKLRQIAESKDKDFFTYQSINDKMWNDEIEEAKNEFGVNFNTENNDSMDDREVVKIDDAEFACEMWSAGGDWEFPLRYFKCQLKSGYVSGRSTYTDPHFVFIPNGKQGNGHLVKDGDKWICPDADGNDVDEEARDEDKCWDSLKDYLRELVDKNID